MGGPSDGGHQEAGLSQGSVSLQSIRRHAKPPSQQHPHVHKHCNNSPLETQEPRGDGVGAVCSTVHVYESGTGKRN